AMVIPAVTTDIIPISAALSISFSPRLRCWLSVVAVLGRVPVCGARGCDVDHGQNGKYVCLDHAGQQPEELHDDREKIRGDAEQDRDDYGAAHDVAVEPDRQGDGARKLADDVERQH